MAWRRRTSSGCTAVLLTVALLAAACGDDDRGGGASAPTTAGGPTTSGAATSATSDDDAADVDPEGVLRIGDDLTSGSGIFFDLTVPVSTPRPWHTMILDTLLREMPDGSIEPGLAESADVVDASTIKVRLKPDITFSDGTPVDAEAVKFTIERNLAEGKPGSFEVEFYELDSITVDDPLSFTIRLKSPVAGAWYRLLRLVTTSPVSPTAVRNGVNLNEEPVGAGPFMLDSYEEARFLRLVKNPSYFDADRIRLAGIEFVQVMPGAPVIVALRSGAIDVPFTLAYHQLGELEGTGINTEARATGNITLQGHICKSRPPFDDVRVRQALNYGIDRDALNAAVYDGKAEPMWGFFPPGHPLHHPAVDGYYEYDPERARALLAEAGQSALTFDAFFTGGVPQRAGEVLQQQLAEIGVTMNLVPLVNQADFFPDARGAPMNILPLARSGLNKVTRVFVPGSYGNVCTYDDPDLNAVVAELRAVREDAPEAKELWAELQEIALEDAITIFGLFGLESVAWGERVGNASFLPSEHGQAPVVNFYDVYIKA